MLPLSCASRDQTVHKNGSQKTGQCHEGSPTTRGIKIGKNNVQNPITAGDATSQMEIKDTINPIMIGTTNGRASFFCRTWKLGCQFVSHFPDHIFDAVDQDEPCLQGLMGLDHFSPTGTLKKNST